MDLFTRPDYRRSMGTHGPFHYRVGEDLVVEAMRRHMIRRLTKGLVGRLFIAVLVMLAALILLDVFVLGRLSGVAIAFLIGLPAVLAINHLWLVPQLGRRQHRQSAALRSVSSMEWDDDTVHFASELGDARIPTASFYRWDETENALLLFQTEMFFNLVPKAALDGEALQLIAALEAAGVKRN